MARAEDSRAPVGEAPNLLIIYGGPLMEPPRGRGRPQGMGA